MNNRVPLPAKNWSDKWQKYPAMTIGKEQGSHQPVKVNIIGFGENACRFVPEKDLNEELVFLRNN